MAPSEALSPLPAEAQAGVLPTARLGPLPGQAPRRALQEHDGPAGHLLPGAETASQGHGAGHPVLRIIAKGWQSRWQPFLIWFFPIFVFTRRFFFSAVPECGCLGKQDLLLHAIGEA